MGSVHRSLRRLWSRFWACYVTFQEVQVRIFVIEAYRIPFSFHSATTAYTSVILFLQTAVSKRNINIQFERVNNIVCCFAKKASLYFIIYFLHDRITHIVMASMLNEQFY